MHISGCLERETGVRQLQDAGICDRHFTECRCSHAQGHRLALYLPAITAVLVVLLEGTVSDLPQEVQQLLPDQASIPPPADTDVSMSQVDQSGLKEEDQAAAVSDVEHEDDDTAEPATGQENIAEAAEETNLVEASTERAIHTQGPQSAAQKSDGGREVRSGVLRLLASIWSRFPAQDHGSPVFSRFFAAVAPLMRRITTEVCFSRMSSQLICSTSWRRALYLRAALEVPVHEAIDHENTTEVSNLLSRIACLWDD